MAREVEEAGTPTTAATISSKLLRCGTPALRALSDVPSGNDRALRLPKTPLGAHWERTLCFPRAPHVWRSHQPNNPQPDSVCYTSCVSVYRSRGVIVGLGSLPHLPSLDRSVMVPSGAKPHTF